MHEAGLGQGTEFFALFPQMAERRSQKRLLMLGWGGVDANMAFSPDSRSVVPREYRPIGWETGVDARRVAGQDYNPGVPLVGPDGAYGEKEVGV